MPMNNQTTARRFGLSGFALKLIAIIAMTCDHVGMLFYPQVWWLRVIGRLTMPIMAFMLVEGFRHTRNVKKYMLRMAVFAIMTAVPYYLACKTPWNVLFTLLLGLCALWVWQQDWHVWLRVGAVAVLALASAFCDWPVVGVVMILGFALVPAGWWKNVAVTGGSAVMAVTVQLASGSGVWSYVHIGLLGAAPLLSLYNGKRGWNAKYLFYVYYPLHLLVLWLMKTYI